MGYFATTFGFEIVTQVVASVGTAVEPSARDLAQVIDRIAEEGRASRIHRTPWLRISSLNTVADETGVSLAQLYSDTLSEIDGPAGTYLDYIRYNTSTIIGALSQGGLNGASSGGQGVFRLGFHRSTAGINLDLPALDVQRLSAGYPGNRHALP